MKIVLASQSPSRRMILTSAGIDPVIHPAEIDEDALLRQHHEDRPQDTVCHLALAKARAIAPAHPGDVIIGGDSMLLLDGELQGKPHTEAETLRRWHRQRGRTAQLITGHAVLLNGSEFVEASATTIRFADPSDTDIAAYAASGEPLECAGAFTLEALGGWFIDAIDGDPSSVIGLSLPVVRRALYSLGLDVSSFWAAERTQ